MHRSRLRALQKFPFPQDHREEERNADQRGDDTELDLGCRGNEAHDDVGRCQQGGAGERRRQHDARRIGAHRAADEMRRDEPDESDRSGDGDGGADTERHADHRIADEAGFRAALAAAATRAAEGDLVTLGITPTGPETGYGYVLAMGDPADAAGRPSWRVERFVEKPTAERAAELLAGGRA